MTRAVRTNAEVRKNLILEAAITLAKRVGYKTITRDDIAFEADIASSLVAHYYPTMFDIKRAVMVEAAKREIVEILAQGIALGDRIALTITPRLKKKVLKYLSEM